jgi:hypothetical protein
MTFAVCPYTVHNVDVRYMTQLGQSVKSGRLPILHTRGNIFIETREKESSSLHIHTAEPHALISFKWHGSSYTITAVAVLLA